MNLKAEVDEKNFPTVKYLTALLCKITQFYFSKPELDGKELWSIFMYSETCQEK